MRPAGLFLAFMRRRMSPERCPILWTGEIATVRLPVEVDMSNAESVLDDLSSALADGAKTLIVDMSATTFCDSAGVSVLVRTHQKAAANDSRLRIATQSSAVQRVLSLTSVDTLIPVFPTPQAAQSAP
jgi:anti-sigma B factor antagonist